MSCVILWVPLLLCAILSLCLWRESQISRFWCKFSHIQSHIARDKPRQAGIWTVPQKPALFFCLKCCFSPHLSLSASECMRVVESTSSEWPLRSSFSFLLNCSEVQMKEWREGAWDFFLFKASALERHSRVLLSVIRLCMRVCVCVSGRWGLLPAVLGEHNVRAKHPGKPILLLLWPEYRDHRSLHTPIPQQPLVQKKTLQLSFSSHGKTLSCQSQGTLCLENLNDIVFSYDF